MYNSFPQIYKEILSYSHTYEREYNENINIFQFKDRQDCVLRININNTGSKDWQYRKQNGTDIRI